MLHEALRLFGTASAIRWGLRLMPKKETGSHRSDVDCHVKPVTASSCTQKFILLHLINLLLNSSLDFLDKPTECRSKLYARISVSFFPLDLLSVDCKMCVRDVFRLAHPVNFSVSNLAVISGDTLVLRGRPGPQGQSPKERCATPNQSNEKPTHADTYFTEYYILPMSWLREWETRLGKTR
jgi:hypothetical protein